MGARILSLLFLFLAVGLQYDAHAADFRSAMVKITTVQNPPNYANPWNMYGPRSVSGSGCIIEGGRVLTNAHVVSDQTYIEVQRYGETKKYPARVEAVSHEADLALLSVEESAFFEGVTPLGLGELPTPQQEVSVFGFPLGGDTLSTTTGVISRIEHTTYVHSNLELFAIQLDAAVNPGNSGGPAISGGRIVGVVMQVVKEANNIGYIVPAPIVKHFLTDIADGRHDGFPADGILTQPLENEALRAMHQMGDRETGCLVVRIIPGSPADGLIRVGDVVTGIDGHDVADDCTVEFRPQERTLADYYIQLHQIGESAALDILREGKKQTVSVPLKTTANRLRLVPHSQYDVRPTYYIHGGLVFSPLTLNFLASFGKEWANSQARNMLLSFYHGEREEDGEEVVVLIRVLPASINRGYHNFSGMRITEVNGRKIRNLRELIRIIEEDGKGPFVEFLTNVGAKIVLDRKDVDEASPRILHLYNIQQDRSVDLGPLTDN